MNMDRHALGLKVLKRRLLQLEGIDVNTLSVEDLALENIQLKHQNEDLSKRTPSKVDYKKLVDLIIEGNKFGKKQAKLLSVLWHQKPIKATDLALKTKSKNVKSLVRDTNKHLKKYYPGEIIIKPPYKANLEGHYQLIISIH